MRKSNVTKNKWNTATRRFEPFPSTIKYQCPICKKLVLQEDFISSYRLIENLGEPAYQFVNLCRTCRDSGL
jgi:hypothetical protein